MELVATDIGLLSLALLIILYVIFARALPFGALSMPCMTLLTSMMYFFIMPAFAMSGGNFEFLGMYLTSLEGVHIAYCFTRWGALPLGRCGSDICGLTRRSCAYMSGQ